MGDTVIAEAALAAVLMYGADDVVPPLAVDDATAAFRDCVADRESRFDHTAVSRTGKYRGKYQFSDALKRGATWHMLPWLREWHPDAKRYAAQLRRTPMNRWPEVMQDAAFVFTLHHDGVRWVEWRHWFLAGSPCNDLVPAGAR